MMRKRMRGVNVLTRRLTLLIMAVMLLVPLVGCSSDDGTKGCPECGGRLTVSEEKEPTALKPGVITSVCEGCGGEVTEQIPRKDSFKILFIGDYTVLDAADYLDEILAGFELDELEVAFLTSRLSSGISVGDHLANLKAEDRAYTLTRVIGGKNKFEYGLTLTEGLQYVDWDEVILTETISSAADGESYSPLGELVKEIEGAISEGGAGLHWMMPPTESGLSASERLEAFGRISANTREQVMSLGAIDGIIPVATAIESFRAVGIDPAENPSGLRIDKDSERMIAALTVASYFADVSAEEIDLSSLGETEHADLIKEAVDCAMKNNFEPSELTVKSIKLLVFGNSYANDALRYLTDMLKIAGYEHIIVGQAGESSMLISDHYNNIDDDPDNDYVYKGHSFSVHRKTVNGVKYDMPADYKEIVRDEDWDYILFYQGPNSAAALGEEKYYSRLAEFTDALRKNMTNPDEGKIVYYMTWAHNVEDTYGLYRKIADITENIIANDKNIDGIIPAATLIENLRVLGFKGGAGGDITRDWGHLNYGLGRYAMGLLWYSALTGRDNEDITFMPTLEDATESEKKAVSEGNASFTDVTEENIQKIRDAVKASIKNYYDTVEI